MSQLPSDSIPTAHAMLVIFGHFAQHIGLVPALEQVALAQKVRQWRPQGKVIEFMVAMLGGLPYLQDISRAAEPLDQDQAVAQAWGQAGWADYSGVSRTLQALSQSEAEAIGQVLQAVSQPFIRQEVRRGLQQQGYLLYDADLTGRAVSDGSTSFPEATYGYMDGAVRLGYQSVLLSLASPTYGRLWLAVKPAPATAAARDQMAELIALAEARSGQRPRRRTELLQQRLAQAQAQCAQLAAQCARSQAECLKAQAKLARWAGAQTYRQRPAQQLAQVSQCWQRRQERLAVAQAQVASLSQRLERCEQDNAGNPQPIRALFRLDAGFGTCENIALLIEMGYEVYTKPYAQALSDKLWRQAPADLPWTPLAAGLAFALWPDVPLPGLPYTVDVGLQRRSAAGGEQRCLFLHFGQDPVTAPLAHWPAFYNGRQCIEAGIKENKATFQMQHLKVRSQPALWLQEQLAAFAANFVRWAIHWLAQPSQPTPTAWLCDVGHSMKHLVHISTQALAEITPLAHGCLVRFSNLSLYAGAVLQIGGAQLPLPLAYPVASSSGFT